MFFVNIKFFIKKYKSSKFWFIIFNQKFILRKLNLSMRSRNRNVWNSYIASMTSSNFQRLSFLTCRNNMKASFLLTMVKIIQQRSRRINTFNDNVRLIWFLNTHHFNFFPPILIAWGKGALHISHSNLLKL